jgi:hypothetical protein
MTPLKRHVMRLCQEDVPFRRRQDLRFFWMRGYTRFDQHSHVHVGRQHVCARRGQGKSIADQRITRFSETVPRVRIAMQHPPPGCVDPLIDPKASQLVVHLLGQLPAGRDQVGIAVGRVKRQRAGDRGVDR